MFAIFLSHVSTAMLTRSIDIGILSVRPFVRPSRSGTASKRLNISSFFLQHYYGSQMRSIRVGYINFAIFH